MIRRSIVFGLLSGLALPSCPFAADPASPFGVNIHAPENEHLEFALDRVAAAGIGWVRIDFVWAAVEPEPGIERWRAYDAIVAAARARGVHVLALVAYTPAWATDGPEISGVPRDASDWSDFCYRAASRYREDITHWEIWNEPNLERFWSGNRSDYVERILLPAATAIRAANADARIGGPALSHSTAEGRDWIGWLIEVLTRAGDELDFLTHHAYDLEDPAGVFRRLAGETPFGGDPSRWGEAPPSLREVLAHLAFDRSVWLTETGWVTTRLDESLQADHYRRFLDLWLGGGARPAWPARVFFYELEDSRDPRFAKYGLLRVSGKRKPAYRVLREFVAAYAPPPEEGDPPTVPPGPGERRPRTPLPD
jgi:hypothetical protein